MGLGVKIGFPGGTNLGKQVIGVNLLVEDKSIYICIYLYTYHMHAQACIVCQESVRFFIVVVDIYQWVCRNILRLMEIEGR